MRFAPALLLSLLLLPAFAYADVNPKPDDVVTLQLSAEDWVTTKTARTVIQVNAAVSSANAGSTRESMLSAVKQLADANWRLTSFNRSQTQTGLENWFARFEARLPESALGGLNEKATKLSKPGMQLTVGEIDFTPTLEETEAVRGTLRKSLMEKVANELKAVNAAFPGRDFRIAEINFGSVQSFMLQRSLRMKNANMAEAAMAPAPAFDDGGASVQTAQKLNLSVSVTFAALAPVQPAR